MTSMQDYINHSRSMVDAEQNPYEQFAQYASSSVVVKQKSSTSDRLIPIRIDMNKNKNMKEHSTIYYDIPGLVLRRGQEFSIVLIFNQTFQPEKYHLSLIFKSQTWQNFPVIKIPLNDSFNGWFVKTTTIEDQKSNHVGLQILSSSNALIGKYSLLLEVHSKNKEERSVFQFDTDIYFLFNPWKNDDSCGLLSFDQIAEYVMNEHGEIYLGSSDIPRSIPWYFGQFESVVLLAALTLLNKVQLPIQQQIDSSLIVRILASKICSNPGIINGIFPSLFDIQPLSCQDNGYTSSPAILKQYLLSNGQSIQGDSGTNWQHAAIFCSLCRSLGIPCRMVTVYNAYITRPWYLWNECWIHRNDLPKNNSGWQVVNSSSIQYDKKIRCLGPCSVAALKVGMLDLKWDTSEIYRLLNGNQRSTNNILKIKILTKSLKNDQTFEDLTNNYISTETFNTISSNHDVNIDMKIPDTLKTGENLNVIFNINNLSNEQRTVTVAVKLVQINPIEDSQIPIQSFVQIYRLDHNQPKTIQLKLAQNHQVWKKCFESLLKLNIDVIVKETGQIYRREKYILNEENVTMKLFFDDDVIEIGQSAKLSIIINNLPFHLWNIGRIALDGFGILKSFSIQKELSWKHSITIPIKIVPSRIGIGRLYVTFSTDSLCLSPQSILLEVTELIEKNIKINEHVKVQQSSIHKELLPNTSQDVLQDKTVTNDINEALMNNTSTTFTAPVEANNTDNLINQQQDQSIQTSDKNNIHIPLSNTSTTADEQQKSNQETNFNTDLLPQSKAETIEQITESEAIDKEQDTPSISVRSLSLESNSETIVAKESERNSTEDGGIDQRTELQTTVPFETISTSLTPAFPAQTYQEENESLNSHFYERNPRSVTEISITEDQKDDQTKLWKIQSLDKTIEKRIEIEETNLAKIPFIDHTIEKINQILNNQEKKEDDQSKLPDIPFLGNMSEIITNSTTYEKNNEDKERKLAQIPSLDSATESIIETTSVETSDDEDKDELPKSLLVNTPAETISDQDEKDDEEQRLEKTPLLNTTVETVTAATTVENKEEDTQVTLPKIPSLDDATQIEVATSSDENNDRQLPKVPSLDHTEETIIVENNDRQLPKVPFLDNTAETIVVENNDRQLPKVPSLDNTEETIIVENNDRQLPKVPSLDNTAETIVVENNDRQLPKVPFLDNTVETIIGENNDRQLPKVPSLDNTEETIIVENNDRPLPKVPSLENTAETMIDQNNDQQLPTVPFLDNTVETIIGENNDRQLPKVPSLDNTEETIIVENNDRQLPKVPSLDNTEETIIVENNNRQLPKVPSLDNTAETIVVENNDQQLRKVPSLDNTEETITLENNDQQLPKVPSLDNIEETIVVENNDQQLPKVSSLDNTEETIIVENNDRQLPEVPSLDNTEETIMVENNNRQLPKVSSLDNTEETIVVENNDRQLPKVPCLDNTAETFIVEDKLENDETNNLQAPFLKSTTETVIETSTIDNRTDDYEINLRKIPSLDNTTETIIINSTVENSRDSEESRLPKIPSLDNFTEIVTETTTVEENNEENKRRLSKASSLEDAKETVTDITAIEEKKQDEKVTILDFPSSDDGIISIKKINESVTDETNKDGEGRELSEKIPSLDTTTDLVTETRLVEDKKEDNERQVPKVSSLDNMIEITTVQGKKEDEEKLSNIPSLDTAIEDKKEFDETELLMISSWEPTEEIVTEITTVEKKKESKEQQLPKIPSLDNSIETITETTLDEDKKEEDKERILPKIPSLETTIETFKESTDIEDKTDDKEIKLLKTSSVEITPKTVTETLIGEDKENDEGQSLQNISSLENIVEAVTKTTKIEVDKESEEAQLSDKLLLDITGEQENQLTKVPSLETTIETIDGTSPIHIQIPESFMEMNGEITESEHTLEDKDATSPSVLQAPQSIIDTEVRKTAENEQSESVSTSPAVEKVQEVSENAESTTDDSYPFTNVIQQNDDSKNFINNQESITAVSNTIFDTEPTEVEETKTKEESDSRAENLKIWLDNLLQRLDLSNETKTDEEANIILKTTKAITPAVNDSENKTKIEETATFIDNTTNNDLNAIEAMNISQESNSGDLKAWLDDLPREFITLEETKINEESDSPVENLKIWLDNLLQRLDLSNETKIEETTTFIDNTTNNDLKDIGPMNISQESNGGDLKASLDDLLREFITLEETKTNKKRTILSDENSDVVVQKTTIITETTTTTKDEDFSAPVEYSTNMLKHLVHQTAFLDEINSDEEPMLNATTITDDSHLKTLEEHIEKESVDESFINTNTTSSSSSISSITTNDDTNETINNPESKKVIDRAHSNMTTDRYSVISDPSLITSISDSDDTSDSEEQTSDISEERQTRTATMSTIRDAESLNDEITIDVDKESLNDVLNSLILYAEFLACKILASAIDLTAIESNETTPEDNDSNYISPEQLVTIDEINASDEPTENANISIDLVKSVVKDNNNDKTVSDN